MPYGNAVQPFELSFAPSNQLQACKTVDKIFYSNLNGSKYCLEGKKNENKNVQLIRNKQVQKVNAYVGFPVLKLKTNQTRFFFCPNA